MISYSSDAEQAFRFLEQFSMYTRRRFLAVSGSLAVSAAIPKGSFAAGPSANVVSPQSLGHYLQGTMTMATFERVLGSVFTAFLNDGTVARLQLTGVTSFGGDAPPAAQATADFAARSSATAPSITLINPAKVVKTSRAPGFSLTFSVKGDLTEQGTYLLDHGQVGRLALFLVPSTGSCTATVITQIFGSTTPRITRLS